MKLLAFTIFALGLSLAHAQGDITITKDNRIDGLAGRQAKIEPPALNVQIDGYRIQLFFDSNRGALNDARAQFFARYPKIDTYQKSDPPNFFLRAGDFRTRLEAEKVMAEIEDIFPTSFIVKEKINLPRLEKEGDDD